MAFVNEGGAAIVDAIAARALRRTDIKITATTIHRFSLTLETLARVIGTPAVRQGRVAKVLPLRSRRTEYEPEVQLPGQRRGQSFFSSLKKERIKKQIYKNRELATNDVADYIDRFYNRTRRHSHLGGVSPEQFEAAQKHRRRSLH